MNTRQAIQPSNDLVVLSIQFSPSHNRFIAGLSQGCRLFRADNCLTTYQPTVLTTKKQEVDIFDGGISVATILDDRYLAFVRNGRRSRESSDVLYFWDSVLGKAVTSFNLHEPIISLRLSSRYLVVILLERSILFEYQDLITTTQQSAPPHSPILGQVDHCYAPNKVHSLHQTSTNQFGLAVLQKDLLALPGQTTGQVQLIPLPQGSKRVLRAHNSQLRALALSTDCRLLATASVQGTLIRVYDTTTLDQVAEFRRGVDPAIIYSLAISPGNRWVAGTSDKGTLHTFDLKPDEPLAGSQSMPSAHPTRSTNYSHGKGTSQSTFRASSQAFSPSLNSAAHPSPPDSVQFQGSVQEYYGLLPPPSSAGPASHSSAISALSAFKNSALAPRVLKDVRSIASASFWLGDEKPHWQGGISSSWITGPDGSKRRVTMPVPPLPNDPSGRPPKGILAFAPEEARTDGATLYVIGGGSDPRWEKFELVIGSGAQRWILQSHGCRKYMTRQFVDSA